MRNIFFILFLFPVLLSAQNRAIDSLKLALKNSNHDTTRCAILNQLTEVASDEEWPKFNEQLLKLSESKLRVNLKQSYERKLFMNYYAAALNNVGVLATYRGDLKEALECYYKSLKIKEEIGDKRGIAAALNNIGGIFQNQGDIKKTLEYYYQSLKIKEDIGDKKGVAVSLSNIGFLYQKQGDIPKALEVFSKSLKIREALGDNMGIAQSLHNIGDIYSAQNDVPRAIEYYSKSLKIAEQIGDKRGAAGAYHNLGTIFLERGDIKKAFEYLNRSSLLLEEVGDLYGVARTQLSIGALYQQSGQDKKALECFSNSLAVFEKLGDKNSIALALNNLASIYNQQKKYLKAAELANKSLRMSKELGFPESIRNASHLLSIIGKASGNYTMALENYELFIQMRDSINNEKTKKASIKNQLKYEYEKKAAADSVKNAEEQKVKDAQLVAQNASLKSEKTQRYALYGGLVLVIFFLGFVFNRFRVTNKQKKIIEEQKITVDQAFNKLAEKNKEVMDSIHYAKRIQTALLPSQKYFERLLNELNKN